MLQGVDEAPPDRDRAEKVVTKGREGEQGEEEAAGPRGARGRGRQGQGSADSAGGDDGARMALGRPSKVRSGTVANASHSSHSLGTPALWRRGQVLSARRITLGRGMHPVLSGSGRRLTARIPLQQRAVVTWCARP